LKKLLVSLAAFACLISIELYAFDDPFDTPPKDVMPNCSQEYRYRYNESIHSSEAFIAFLKKHQGGEKYPDAPLGDTLIPMYLEHDPLFAPNKNVVTNKSKIKVELDKVKTKVKILEINNSSRTNNRIYELAFGWGDYPGSGPYAWRIIVRMSDRGDVSVRYCAGK